MLKKKKKKGWKDLSFQIEKLNPMKIKLHFGLLCFIMKFQNTGNRRILREMVETRQQSSAIEILMKLFTTKNSITSQKVNQA